MVSPGRTGLQEVAPGAWAMLTSYIGKEGGGPHAGFILAGDEVIVIDSLVSLASARELLTKIREIAGKEPTFLINTHAHPDHIIGNQILAPPATIIAHEKAREVLLQEGSAIIDGMVKENPALSEDLREARIVLPDITYRSHMTLYFGGRTIELIHPGVSHTAGDTLVYLKEEKVLYAGDLLFNHIVPPVFGDSAGWIAALERIESMDVKVIVPGHGFVCSMQAITELKGYLVRLRQQVKECYDRKLSKEEALAEINMGIYRDWPHQERLMLDVEQLYKEFGNSG